MEIIKLTDKNYLELSEIDKSAFKNYWTADEFLLELKSDFREYYGVLDNSKLVAYVGLNVVLDECDIMRIAVLKSEQNKGIAKKLLHFVCDCLKQRNINKIMLEVSDINTPAINLYKSVGFKQIYIREKYYEDNSNALIFSLKL